MGRNEIEVTYIDRFTRFDLMMANQLMYMDAQRITELIHSIDEPLPYSGQSSSLKNAQQYLESERYEE